MNIKQSLRKGSEDVERFYKNGLISAGNIGDKSAFQALDDFETINKYWNYNIDKEKEIVSSLDDATKDLVYLNSESSWYVKNDQGSYEKYGVYAYDNILPEGYTQLEYLTTNGSFIDTGFVPTSNTRFVASFKQTARDYRYPHICGVGTQDTGMGVSNEPDWCWSFLNSQKRTSSIIPNLNEQLIVDVDRYNFIVNGETIMTRSDSCGSLADNYTLWLFDQNYFGDITQQPGYYYQGDFYYIKIYDNGVLVRNYIPCINEEGVVGFYETVNQKFCGSDNSTAFIAGSILQINTTYKGKLKIVNDHEYKWNGSEWVDLGELISKTYIGVTNTAKFQGFNSKWNNGYHLEFDYTYTSSSYSNNEYYLNLFGPLEFAFWGAGFYFDTHNPTSTTSDSLYTGDYSKRIIISSLNEIKKDGTLQTIRLGYNDMAIYNYGEQDPIYTNGSFYSQDWYDGEYTHNAEQNLNPNNLWYIRNSGETKALYLFGIRIYDESNMLIHKWVVKSKNNTYTYDDFYLEDEVTGDTFENSLTSSVSYNVKTIQKLIEEYPVIKNPTFSLSTSYKNLLKSHLYNGENINVNNQNYYEVSNDKLNVVEKQIIITNVHGHWRKAETASKDGYNVFESNDSKGINNEYDLIKVEYVGITDFQFLYGSYAESSYDFTVIGDIDVDHSGWTYSNMTGYKYTSQSKSSSSAPNLEGSFSTDASIHFFYVMYRKDGSSSTNNDRGYIAFPNNIPVIII